ncbi:MAG: isochorismatase family protein, partial [candidate division NC10 bacterium]
SVVVPTIQRLLEGFRRRGSFPTSAPRAGRSTRDAADRGYRCLLVEDGCGAASQRLHEAACANFQRLLGRVDSAVAVLRELGAA